MPIRSLWQIDIAEAAPAGVWQLLCPGPSLERTVSRARFALPAIAVSQAIRAPIPCGWWADWEAPDQHRHRPAWLHRGSASAGPTIITSSRHSKAWHRFMADRLYGDPLVVGQAKTDPLPDPWGDARLDTGPAWVLAIRAMVLRGRAKLIHAYGLDLAGEGYAYQADDPKHRTPEEWEGRWVGERTLLTRMVKLLDSLGVELVIEKP